MYLLHDSASGYALFRVLDEAALSSPGPSGPSAGRPARELLELVSFHQHASVSEALEAQVSCFQGELAGSLRRFLKKSFLELARASPGERLLVPEARLASALRERYGVAALHQDAAVELGRLARACAPELIRGFSPEHEAQLSLGLAHAFSRYRVKFGSGALDAMVIQAVSLVDDSEKELNTLSSRLREWESWHFSELEPLVEGQLAYARTVALIRSRAQMQAALDDPARREAFLARLDEASGGAAAAIVRAARTSVGTDITEEDAARISALAEEVVRLSAYREELHAYVQNRMAAIAPNFTAVVGPVVGARLIAKAGSLMGLAKYAASTVQVLGAERALFRAKKDRSGRTPKYGYLYHAEYVSRASPQNKGRMARAVATAASLAARVDALAEGPAPDFAAGRLAHLGRALQYYEGGRASRAARRAQAAQKMGEYRRREGLSSAARPRDAGEDVRAGAAGSAAAAPAPVPGAPAAAPVVPAAPAAPAAEEAVSKREKPEKSKRHEKSEKSEKSEKREKHGAEAAGGAVDAEPADAPRHAREEGAEEKGKKEKERERKEKHEKKREREEAKQAEAEGEGREGREEKKEKKKDKEHKKEEKDEKDGKDGKEKKEREHKKDKADKKDKKDRKEGKEGKERKEGKSADSAESGAPKPKPKQKK